NAFPLSLRCGVSKSQSSKRFAGVVLEMVGIPLLWGMILTFSYYFAVHRGFFQSPLLARYTAGHWVEYAEVGLFFVGLVAVFRRGRLAFGQLMRADAVQLPTCDGEPMREHVENCHDYLAGLPESLAAGPYARRLTSALAHIRRHDSTEQLEDELKYLSDVDAERTHEGYALVRMIIWATPMLGFLGTVIGITLALGDLSPEALVNSPKDAMEGLLSGLSVAFDTTALALTLSIFLMFAQFVTQQVESQLMMLVDRRVNDDLAPIFQAPASVEDAQVTTLRQLATAMVEATEENSRRQSDVWKTALEQAHRQWASLMQSAGTAIQAAVAGAVQQSMDSHAENLMRLEKSAGEVATDNWRQWREVSQETLHELRTQQLQVTQQVEVMQQVLQATGNVIKLEDALNQNLRALAGAKNFEDTVMSLSAAIHLLSSRLSRPLPRDSQVKLDAGPQERAA
ncbi:MAG: MotA/TolQ/ExbB proton channel family protein, partial [Planctomycetales bacterium]|nr:MotA/TolQ/ExbB proton channel family protein [Planctomycetales bacterium]